MTTFLQGEGVPDHPIPQVPGGWFAEVSHHVWINATVTLPNAIRF